MPSPTPTATDDRTTETPDTPLTTAEPVETPCRRRVPTFGLSLTQLIAAGLATTTATVAASFLGVTGTVIGAALASVTTAVGNAVYGQSLRGGRDRLRAAVPVLGGTAAHAPAAAPETTRRPDVVPLLPAAPPVRPLVWKRVAIGAVSVFVAVLAVVTGVEVVAGRPIADVVRGDSGSGTSFFGGSTVVTRTSVVTPPVPTMTVTVTPKVVTSTPTVTATAPATTKTATSGTTTVTPTPSDTTSPSGSSTPTGTPTPSG